jgi:hypothetical protein
MDTSILTRNTNFVHAIITDVVYILRSETIMLQEAKWMDKWVFDTNMHTTIHGGNHVNTSDTVERTMKGRISGWIAAASEVGWRSKENKTKISFQCC